MSTESELLKLQIKEEIRKDLTAELNSRYFLIEKSWLTAITWSVGTLAACYAVSWQGASVALSKQRGDAKAIEQYRDEASNHIFLLKSRNQPVFYGEEIVLTMPGWDNKALSMGPSQKLTPTHGRDETFRIQKK